MEGVNRDTFIQENMGLVRMSVNRFTYRMTDYNYVDKEDLQSIGTIGLIKAYDRFDPSFGTKFSTYAVPTIIGEIQRYFRDNLDTVKFSRQSKTDFYEISSANLLNENLEVIADTLEIPIIRVKNALDYYRYKNVSSLDKELYDDEGASTTLANTVGIKVDFDSDLEIEMFLNKLDERTKKIVELRLQEKSQAEIGRIMGVSQVQISRTLTKLQKELKGGIKVSENKPIEKKVIEKEEIKVNKKQVIQNKSADYKLAKKLAEETELSPVEIRDKARVSYTTATNYIKYYRLVQEEKEIAKKIPIVEVAPVAMEKHRLDIPEEVISKPKIGPADGFMTMTFKLTVEDAKSQFEGIIKAMETLGFEDLNITIQSKKVA